MKCLDEQTLHSYFDGELSSERSERVARHVNECAACHEALRVVEEEAVLFASLFADEASLAIPTERIRARLEQAMILTRDQPSQPARRSASVRERLERLIGLSGFRTGNRKVALASLAGLAAVAAVLAVLLARSSELPTHTSTALVTQTPQASPNPHVEAPPEIANRTGSNVAQTAGHNTSTRAAYTAKVESVEGASRARRSGASKASLSRKNVQTDALESLAGEQARRSEPRANAEELIPGERSYLEAIAALSTTMGKDGDGSLPPELRAVYRRNLDVVDEAIAATRRTAATDTSDTVAANFLREAYESKLDLLTSIATQMDANRNSSVSHH